MSEVCVFASMNICPYRTGMYTWIQDSRLIIPNLVVSKFWIPVNFDTISGILKLISVNFWCRIIKKFPGSWKIFTCPDHGRLYCYSWNPPPPLMIWDILASNSFSFNISFLTFCIIFSALFTSEIITSQQTIILDIDLPV